MSVEKYMDRMKPLGILYVDVYPYDLDDAGTISILLLKRREDRPLSGSWQLVSGKLLVGETIRHAFLRQLEKKTGLRPVEMFKLDHLGMFYDDSYDTVMVVPAAACRLISRDVRLDDSLHSDFLWVPAAEVERYLEWPNQIASVREIIERVGGDRPFSEFHRLDVSN
jgi:ADP-ribose pyrophosphatase YjhB (NUDIX family)